MNKNFISVILSLSLLFSFIACSDPGKVSPKPGDSGSTQPAAPTEEPTPEATATPTPVPTAEPPRYNLYVTQPAYGGTINVSPGNTVYEGETVTVTLVPDIGFDFLAWQGDVAGETELSFDMTVTRDMTIRASLEYNHVGAIEVVKSQMIRVGTAAVWQNGADVNDGSGVFATWNRVDDLDPSTTSGTADHKVKADVDISYVDEIDPDTGETVSVMYVYKYSYISFRTYYDLLGNRLNTPAEDDELVVKIDVTKNKGTVHGRTNVVTIDGKVYNILFDLKITGFVHNITGGTYTIDGVTYDHNVLYP